MFCGLSATLASLLRARIGAPTRRHKKMCRKEGAALQRVALLDLEIETVLGGVFPKPDPFQAFGVCRLFTVNKTVLPRRTGILQLFQIP